MKLLLLLLTAGLLSAQTTEMGTWIRYKHHLSYQITIHITYTEVK